MFKNIDIHREILGFLTFRKFRALFITALSPCSRGNKNLFVEINDPVVKISKNYWNYDTVLYSQGTINISWNFGEILFLFSQLITGKTYESQKFFQHPSYQLQNKNPKKKMWINQVNHVQAITYADTYCNINIGKRMDIFCWTFIRLYPCYFGCLLPIILFFKYQWAPYQSYVRLCRQL